MSNCRKYVFSICLLGSIFAVSFPFLFVDLVPSTDLYQHVSQVRLFIENFGLEQSKYQFQYLTPYWLGYLAVFPFWLIFEPIVVGKYALLFLGILWVASIYSLTYLYNLSLVGTLLATIFFFNHALAWGYLPFLAGFPIFVVWYIIIDKGGELSYRYDALSVFISSVLLYFTHALWFAAGMGWLALFYLIPGKREWRRVIFRFVAVLPVVSLAGWWYPRLSNQGFDSATHWFILPTGRLSLSWLTKSSLGMHRGILEYGVLVVIGILAVLIFAYKESPEKLRGNSGLGKTTKMLLLAFLMFFLLAAVLPNKFQNTISFASRWMPIAAIFGLLSLPRTSQKRSLFYAGTFLLIISLVVGLKWRKFEQEELTGLKDSITKIPKESRVLGLDYRRKSSTINGEPFLQLVALAQVVKGAEINFSFAEFPQFPVVLKRQYRPWTGGLEWYPERLKKSDLEYFDYILMNAKKRRHIQLKQNYEISPKVDKGYWRLYKIE